MIIDTRKFIIIYLRVTNKAYKNLGRSGVQVSVLVRPRRTGLIDITQLSFSNENPPLLFNVNLL